MIKICATLDPLGCTELPSGSIKPIITSGRCYFLPLSNLNSQESEDGGGESGRLVSGPSVVSASSYDSGGAASISQSNSGSSIRVDEGDDVRVACAMIVRKQVTNVVSMVPMKRWVGRDAEMVLLLCRTTENYFSDI